MKKFPWIIILFLSVALALSIQHNVQLIGRDNTYTDTLTVRDTIPFRFAVPKDSVVVRYTYIPATVPPDTTNKPTNNSQHIESSSDSVLISIPITQKKYETKSFTAWVSGYNPQLDSCFVYPETNTIIHRTPQAKWNVDVQAGVDIFNNTLYPYANIGMFAHTNSQWEVGIYIGAKLDGNHINSSINIAVRRRLFAW